MEVEFHGVRGSIPVASEKFLGYGGNTTCIEIISKDFQLIIDAGSGFKDVRIREEVPSFLLFSHFHHDHLQGLAFNSAMFSKNHQVHISSGLVTGKRLKEVLSTAFMPPLFPLDLVSDNPTFNIMNFETFQAAAVDFFSVETFTLSHPGGAIGYKITADKSSIVCGLDHEYGINKKLDSNFLDKADNSDLVVWDGMFTHLELRDKYGWGHSSIEQGIDFSSSAKCKLLLITHHSPQREDYELNKLAQELFPPNVRFAKENEKIKI